MKDELGVPVSIARSWNEMLLILEDFRLLGEGFSLRVKQTSLVIARGRHGLPCRAHFSSDSLYA